MKKLDHTVLIGRSLDDSKFQVVTTLDPQYVKCKKEDLKTEISSLGVVQRRLARNESIDVFRLIPNSDSLENMNRENRRNAKKQAESISPIDEIIRYPALNIYPVALYYA